jgi:hypothetical protein
LKQQQVLSDFTFGELSPNFYGRFDLQAYAKGAREVTNWIPLSPGGAAYTPGSDYLGTPYFDGTDANNDPRLVPFIISDLEAFVLEFTPGHIRAWKGGALVAGFDQTTTYTRTELWALCFAQDANTLVLTCNTHPIRTLKYLTGDAFQLEDLAITNATAAIAPEDGKDPLGVPFQTPQNYPALCAFYEGRLYVAGTITKPQTAWASKPGDYGNFTFFDQISSTRTQLRNPHNVFLGNTTEGSAIVSGIDPAVLALFKVGDRITGPGIKTKAAVQFAGSTTADGTTITNLSSEVTAALAVGETVQGTNIPTSIIQSIGPNSIQLDNTASATSDINTFTRGEIASTVLDADGNGITLSQLATATATGVTLAQGWADPLTAEYEITTNTRNVITQANAFDIPLASDISETVAFLAAGKELVLGTTTGQRIIPKGTTATNKAAIRMTAYSSAKIKPVLFNDALLFVEADGKNVREYAYSNEAGAYQSPHLNFTASHLLASGVRQIDYQNTPLPIAWFLGNDGILYGCHYSKLYGIQAWFRRKIEGGTIESFAVIPSGGTDQVYAAVKIGTKRFIVLLEDIGAASNHLDATITGKKSPAGKFADAGDTAITVPANGAWVAISGGQVFQVTATGYQIDLPAGIATGAAVTVGLAIKGKLEILPIASQGSMGTGQMRSRSPIAVIARLLASYPFKAGRDEATADLAHFTGPFTGDQTINIRGAWDTEGRIVIVQDAPYDVTILALLVEIDQGG